MPLIPYVQVGQWVGAGLQANVAYEVNTSAGAPATLYGDPLGQTAIGSVLVADASGRGAFTAAPGNYTLVPTGPGVTGANVAASVVASTLAANASNPVLSLLGQTTNVTNTAQPARSNLEWFGLGTPTDTALAATGIANAVAVPVDWGQTFTRASLLVGAAAEATGTHAWAAVYSGIAVPALIQQAVDLTGATAVGPVNTRFDFTIPAVTANPTNAPNKFLYVSISVTAGTIPSVASWGTPTAIGYQFYATGPLFLSATHGSAVLGVAPATIATPAARATCPLVILT